MEKSYGLKTEKEVTADIGQLLNILVDHLQKDPFAPVREYISNAHDATKGQSNPIIQIWAEHGRLNIRDNGKGMTENIILEGFTRIGGHIERLEKNKKEAIGMFGIGVLSAFMVADKLEIETRHSDETHGWRLLWERKARTFNYEPIEKDEPGTLAILHLNEKAPEEIGNDNDLRDYVKKTFGLFAMPIFVGKDIAKGAVNRQWQWVEKLLTCEERLLNDEEIRLLMGQYFPQKKLLCGYYSKGPGGANIILGIPQQESTFTTDWHDVHFFSKGVLLMEEKIRNFFPNNLSFIIGIIDSPGFKIQITREEIFIQDVHFQKLKAEMEFHILRFFDLLAKQLPIIVEQALHIHKTKLIAHGEECDDLCGLFRDYYHFTTTNGQLRWREILPFAEEQDTDRFIYYTADEINAIDLLHGNSFLTVFALGPEYMVLKQIADCECIKLKDIAVISNSGDLVDVPEPLRKFANRIVPYLGRRGIRTVVYVSRPGENQAPSMFRIINVAGSHKFTGGASSSEKVGYSIDALMLNIASPIIGKLAGQQLLSQSQLEKIADTLYQIAVLHSPFGDLQFSVSDAIIGNLVDCLQFRVGLVQKREENNLEKYDCFVALPYRSEFNTVWNSVSNILSEAPYNWNIVRGDQNIQDTNLLDSIKKFVATSKRFIADISGFNHNVLIEMGLMLENHPDGLLIICDEETMAEIPADLRGKLLLVYKADLRDSQAEFTDFFRNKIRTFQAWISLVGSGTKKIN